MLERRGSIICKIPLRYGKRGGPRTDKHSAYAKRDRALFRLGFASYGDYLKSPLWKVIREAKLAVDPRCECCGDKAVQIHHLSYTRKVLIGKLRRKLVSVCPGCHQKIEFRADGMKRSFVAANKQAQKLLRRVGKWDGHTRHGSKPAQPDSS